MKLHDLQSNGAVRKRKRVGRGDGSGNGRTCGRGEKGQKSRSGYKSRPFFEGGQIPLFRRLPKRGFKPISRIYYAQVNVATLNDHFADGDDVDMEKLLRKGIIGKADLGRGLKVLGNGDLTKKLTVKADKFSESAKKKIEGSGGVCEIVA